MGQRYGLTGGSFLCQLLAAGVLLASIGAAGPAFGDNGNNQMPHTGSVRCGPNRTLVSLDEKECPITPLRGPTTVRRACCLGPKDKQPRCHAFPPCPRKSPK